VKFIAVAGLPAGQPLPWGAAASDHFPLPEGHRVWGGNSAPMYQDLYPAPQVKWYPGAQTQTTLQAPRTHPSGLTYSDPTASGPEAASASNASFTSLNAQMEALMRSEYGIRSPGMADQCMSFYTRAAGEAFILPPAAMKREAHHDQQSQSLAPTPTMRPPASSPKGSSGDLIVNIDSAVDLTPTDGFGPHHFCAAAYYPGEPQDVIEARKTAAVKAHMSTTSKNSENCVLHTQVRVPYNSRQQLLMVAPAEVGAVKIRDYIEVSASEADDASIADE
jgi:hypothetical protein